VENLSSFPRSPFCEEMVHAVGPPVADMSNTKTKFRTGFVLL
jgi:hypothetical protein